MQDAFSDLESSLPALIARSEVARLTGGVVNPRTLANLDSEGRGPQRVRIGKKVAYPRGPFVAWLRARAGEAA